MRQFLIFSFVLIWSIFSTSCSRLLKREPSSNVETIKPLVNKKLSTSTSNDTNTLAEIMVYNDIIDDFYNVHFCHLKMDPPEEYFFNRTYSKKEYEDYKKKFDNYLKKFDMDLKRVKITAVVLDSLSELLLFPKLFSHARDSILIREFRALISDSSALKPAAYLHDSLKAKGTYFERLPYKLQDKEYRRRMADDSLNVYTEILSNFWNTHRGFQKDKYYTGFIEMSRVKFNCDSTLCVLNCGYSPGGNCGYGYYVFAKKVKNKWKIIAKLRDWVS